jgi:hypothetical protein
MTYQFERHLNADNAMKEESVLCDSIVYALTGKRPKVSKEAQLATVQERGTAQVPILETPGACETMEQGVPESRKTSAPRQAQAPAGSQAKVKELTHAVS